jgi:hypothetical protein
VRCHYCTATARGLDDEDEPTCGSASCSEQLKELPRVIEVSGEDDEDGAS